jgi:hypothetical protein
MTLPTRGVLKKPRVLKKFPRRSLKRDEETKISERKDKVYGMRKSTYV